MDVFSTKKYKGNPLAVVFTNGGLALGDHQNISKEFGYSKTSFVHDSQTLKALDVRSFTPTGVEVGAGAGHNSLGAFAAALLKEIQLFRDQDEGNHFVMMKDMAMRLHATADTVVV